ncbi:MAG: bifunctional serine/threonine-protein kinase/formylglycine-generating enzyme family protein [Acidobacteria bacterium]|nr:bifunctional serine/threonine-protein kinase/formylglycine-generating enzyme family protein [Acidobacteriota bacterium]
MIGSIIGNYEVISQFGEGGMGELYVGRHIRLAREVIIKTIRTEDFKPRLIEHLRDRLEREAYVQSQLDHPNIVRVYDFIAFGDTTCIVMEYVPGRDLRKMISRETGPIPDRRSIKLFKQALAAINYAHHFIYSDKSGEKHQGIIHRDLKPANILVTPDDMVKVTDFGIVKVRGVKGGTQIGFNPGTPEYMSPEQARGRDLDHRSDIYSLGVVFYEMLCGHVPFEDRDSETSDYEIRRGHIELPVPPLAANYPGISVELEKIVFKALEKDPEDRFQTARQFIDTIEEYERTGKTGIAKRMPGARPGLIRTGGANLATTSTVSVDDTLITDPDISPTYHEGYHNERNDYNPTSLDGYPHDPQKPKISEQSAKLRFYLPRIAIGLVIALIGYGIYRIAQPSEGPTKPVTVPPPQTVSGSTLNMISIPGDVFEMGRDDGNEFEKPAHTVRIEPYLIDRYEVSNELYAEFVRQMNRQAPKHWIDGQYAPGEANFPVVNINWFEARDYCEWVGKRLPTEEEWEFAARGKENRLYPYGNEWKPRFSNAFEDGYKQPRAVGSYPDGASPFGALDMAGNVAEWTATDYRPYSRSSAPRDEGNKVIRGGSFNAPAKEQTATDRFFDYPQRSYNYIGFRCAKNAK